MTFEQFTYYVAGFLSGYQATELESCDIKEKLQLALKEVHLKQQAAFMYMEANV